MVKQLLIHWRALGSPSLRGSMYLSKTFKHFALLNTRFSRMPSAGLSGPKIIWVNQLLMSALNSFSGLELFFSFIHEICDVDNFVSTRLDHGMPRYLVKGDEANTWIRRLRKADCLRQCRWASSHLLEAWLGQKGGRRNMLLSLPVFKLVHGPSALRLELHHLIYSKTEI